MINKPGETWFFIDFQKTCKESIHGGDTQAREDRYHVCFCLHLHVDPMQACAFLRLHALSVRACVCVCACAFMHVLIKVLKSKETTAA